LYQVACRYQELFKTLQLIYFS